jgi:4-amino-4-deoxy-L-arabinose transferase-like glycosyltransferase
LPDRNKRIILLLILAAILVQIAGMTLPFTGDAGKYAAISKNIYQSADFWNLSIHGSPYNQKPPFHMWLITAGFYLFGETGNFSARLFPLLFSLLLIFSTYKLAKLFYTELTGRLAALFIGTSLIYFFYNTDLHTDVVLTSCTTAAIWQLAVYLKKNSWLNLLAGFLFIALGMLTKGPIAVAVPAFAIGAHLLIKREYNKIFRVEWIAGATFCCLLILPYLIVLHKQFGNDGLRFYFWTNNAGRISGEYRGNNSDYYFYLYNLLVFALPWTVFFAGGLIRNISSVFRKGKKTQTPEYLTLGGSLLLILILSFSSMKSPNYFYPAIPLIAVIAADYFQHISTWHFKIFNKLGIYQLVQNSMMWISIIIISIYIFPINSFYIWGLIALLFAFFIIYQFKKTNLPDKVIITSLTTIVALNLLINAHILPVLFDYQASIKAAEIFNKEADDDAIFYTYRYAQFEMFFYAKNKGYKIIDEGTHEEKLTISIDDALKTPGAWYLADEWSYSQIKEKAGSLEKEYKFDHYYLTDINYEFINPKTRESTIQKIYLVKTY